MIRTKVIKQLKTENVYRNMNKAKKSGKKNLTDARVELALESSQHHKDHDDQSQSHQG